MKAKNWRSLAVLLALLALVSCDVFEPRESDPPAETAEWNPFPVSPQMALDNLRYVWIFTQNSTRYGELLTDDFVFYADQQDVVEYGVLGEWDRETETLLLTQYHGVSEFSGDEEFFTAVAGEDDVIDNDDATLVRDYSFSVLHSDETTPATYSGRLALQLERGEDSLWRIASWTDNRKDDETVTWGRMKDEYRP